MNYFKTYKSGDYVSFVVSANEDHTTARVLKGRISQNNNDHVIVKAVGNHHFPNANGKLYYIDDSFAILHSGNDDNEKIRNFMMSNWENYKVVDSKEDFVWLLNALESHNESLEELHSAVVNDHECCNYLGPFKNDKELAATILEDHSFYTGWDELYEVIAENAKDNQVTDHEEAMLMKIHVTHDGFIINHQC